MHGDVGDFKYAEKPNLIPKSLTLSLETLSCKMFASPFLSFDSTYGVSLAVSLVQLHIFARLLFFLRIY